MILKVSNSTPLERLGITILGRDEFMNKRQKEDFEIVKRQYKNIADIMTYGDFLQRLTTSIDQLKSG